jgi:outer membrane lipoprotein-sorting protein
MRWTHVWILAGALATAALAPTPASAGSWYDDWASIRKAAATIKSIEATFVQTRTLKILRKPLVSRGTMAFRRPNDLRWEYQSPLPTLLVAHGGDIHRMIKHDGTWVNDASGRLEAMKVVLGEINLWLDGDFSSSKTFRPALRPAKGSQPGYVELMPVDPSLAKIISRIALSFGERPGTVSAIDIYEEGEGVSHIAFESTRFDQAIPDSRFEPPR